ncbi:MAG TPA: glycosyltransferase family 2 protein [Candidatus Woesebacteria bacterium]|nr:glycosyltransferase family 2 protein [Candidatus Woesebacteria bacterium]
MYQASIIILTWNTADITYKCISTLQKYLDLKKWEIIVVDNGSTDNTQAVLSKLPIVYIKSDINLGFSKGCNLGAKNAHGKYLLFLNSDMELTDGSLDQMLKHYQNNQNIGLIGPQFLNPDLTVQGSIFPPQTPINAFKEFWLGFKAYSKYFQNHLSPVWAISGGAILISQDLFNKINGWNEKYFFYFEDLDLCRKIRNLNYQIVYYPDTKVIHRHGASGKSLANSSDQWKRLIPSSKLFHGLFEYYLISSIIWSSQKFNQLFKTTKSSE